MGADEGAALYVWQARGCTISVAARGTALHARQPGGCTAVKAAEGAAPQLWQPMTLRCSCGAVDTDGAALQL